MNQILTLILLVVILNMTIKKTEAQSNISLVYNSVHIGQNIALNYSQAFGKHSILVGIKYNLNRIVQDNQNEIFKKRFYATNFIEHWGLALGYNYTFRKVGAIEPYVFYELQYTNSHTRNEFVFPVEEDQDGKVYYTIDLVFLGPTTALENYIGVGIIIPVLDNLLITQKVGFGVSVFLDTDPSLVYTNNMFWEMGYMLSAGIAYRFIN